MTKNFIAEKLYPWNRCIPAEERSDWELCTFNSDDFFGTSMLFRHAEGENYAVGVVGEADGSDFFHEIPVLSEIFFAVRQTEEIWVLLAYDGSDEHMIRIRLAPGKEPLILSTELLPSQVSRCIINRRGHILIGYDNSSFFSDVYDREDFRPVTDIALSHAFAGENGTVLPLLEWYNFDGQLIHMFTDNMNTAVTELTIDGNDSALVAVDMADSIIRLQEGAISFIENEYFHFRLIEGLAESGDLSGYLVSFQDEEETLILPPPKSTLLSDPAFRTVWIDPDSEIFPLPCRAFDPSGRELPLDSYCCRGNIVLIEEDGWIFRIIL